jgi:hypothetical protein
MKNKKERRPLFHETMGLTEMDCTATWMDIQKFVFDKTVTKSDAVERIRLVCAGYPTAMFEYWLVNYGLLIGHQEGHACERRLRRRKSELKKFLKAIGLPADQIKIITLGRSKADRSKDVDPNLN